MAAQASFPEAGQIYLSFSPDGRVQDRHVDAQTPFDFYLIVDLDLAGGDPFEFRVVEGSLAFSTEIWVAEIDWIGDIAVNAGAGLSSGSYDFSVAVAPCVTLQDGPNVVCAFEAVLMVEAEDLFVGVGPGLMGSFDGLGPGWGTCADIGYVFEDDGVPRSLSINSPVATENRSWSNVKALYR
jgi:hypothetical protein